MGKDFNLKKIERKQKRCEIILKRSCDAEFSNEPTETIAVLNAGLTTGLSEETLLIAASTHGHVKHIKMCKQSFSFIICASCQDAKSVFEAMHGKACLGQNEAVIYMSYLNRMPVLKNEHINSDIPIGLFVINDFVNAAEEATLLGAVQPETCGNLKHRSVRHFGYEFFYENNNVDYNTPLNRKIPDACNILWPRLEAAARSFGIQLPNKMPDQLTVNEYLPGQGIPPHIDTHSAFLDPIISLSLEDDVVMEFRRNNDCTEVILPRFSLLIMSGETRYDWTHGITGRIFDVCTSPDGFLMPRKRSKRTSLTFRFLRKGPCCCSYPTHCDTQLQKSSCSKEVNANLATTLEERNVHCIYEEIAQHFSATRHSPWPKVTDFLNQLPEGSIVADIGCGNGKYLDVNKQILMLGCDRSKNLLAVCAANGKNVFKCDCLQVPIRDNTVDACISIAVIHHLATEERRRRSVQEMHRILKKGGKGLIYVWAKEQCSDNGKSSYLLQNKAVNKHKTTEEQQRRLQQEMKLPSTEFSDLPVHTNRTNFLQQDVLVPWKLKSAKSSGSKEETFLRFYHVFRDKELEELITQVSNLEIQKYYYDQGNHCIIFTKK